MATSHLLPNLNRPPEATAVIGVGASGTSKQKDASGPACREPVLAVPLRKLKPGDHTVETDGLPPDILCNSNESKSVLDLLFG